MLLAEIRRIGVALEIGEGGLLKIGRDISQYGRLLSLNHMRRQDQEKMLDFLRLVEETMRKPVNREQVFDSMVA